VLAEQAGPTKHLDLPGLLLISAGLFGIVFGIVRGNGHGWTSTRLLTALAAGAGLVVAFVVWETGRARPCCDAPVRSRRFTAVNIAALLDELRDVRQRCSCSPSSCRPRWLLPLAAGLRSCPGPRCRAGRAHRRTAIRRMGASRCSPPGSHSRRPVSLDRES